MQWPGNEGVAAYGSYSPGHWSKTDDESTIPPFLFLPRRRDVRTRTDGSCPSPRPGLSRRRRPPAPTERGCSARQSGALHLGVGRRLADVDTGGGVGGGVSFVVVARSKRDGARRRRRRAATDSDGWLLAAGRGENCRATTDDNAPSPEMIRIIWENYSPVIYKNGHLSESITNLDESWFQVATLSYF